MFARQSQELTVGFEIVFLHLTIQFRRKITSYLFIKDPANIVRSRVARETAKQS